MKALFSSLLAATSLCFSVSTLAAAIIELKDGSRIRGEVQSVERGEYTIVSPSIGTLRTAQSNIVRIVYGGDEGSSERSASGSSAGNDDLSRQTLHLQAQLAQDPSAMESVLSLQTDPQIQALLNDPQIMQAIQEGDYASLLSNPKIQALDNNAQLKAVLQQLGQ